MVTSKVTETHPEFPVDIYSANKTAAEKYTLVYGNAYGMRTTVVRLANTYGPRSNIRSPDFGFMNYFIGLALQGKPMRVFGTGAQIRNVNYVDDVVDALVRAGLSDRTDHEVYFAVSDEHLSVAAIAEAIARHVGGCVEYVEWPRDREGIEIGDARISNAKIREHLGWTPRHDIASGLAATAAYFRSCLNRYLP
jgi:UDP-glucose 4-epimerase